MAVRENRVRVTGTLDVADNASSCVVHEFDAHLSNASTGTWTLSVLPLSFYPSKRLTSPSQNASDLDEFHWNLGGIHLDQIFCTDL